MFKYAVINATTGAVTWFETLNDAIYWSERDRQAGEWVYVMQDVEVDGEANRR